MQGDDQEAIRAAIDSLQPSIAGLTVVMGAFIQTRPRPAHLQLAMTTLLEQQLGCGALSTVLNEQQQEQARDMVEWLGAIRAQKH